MRSEPERPRIVWGPNTWELWGFGTKIVIREPLRGAGIILTASIYEYDKCSYSTAESGWFWEIFQGWDKTCVPTIWLTHTYKQYFSPGVSMECDLILMFNSLIPLYYAVLFLVGCMDVFASYNGCTLVRWKGGNMTDGACWQLRQLLREGTTQVHLRGSGHPQCVIHKYKHCLRFLGSVAGGHSSVWHVHEPESRGHRSWSQIPDPRGAEIGVTDSESSLVGIPRSYGLAVTQLRSTIHLPTRRRLRDKSAPTPPHRFSCWRLVTVVKSQDIFCPWTEWAESEKWNCWKVYCWKRWVTECYPVACRKWPVDFAYLRQRRRELVGLVGLRTHTCATWLTQGTTRWHFSLFQLSWSVDLSRSIRSIIKRLYCLKHLWLPIWLLILNICIFYYTSRSG